MRRLLPVCYVLFLTLRSVSAQEILIVKNGVDNYELTNKYFSVYKDETNLLDELGVNRQKFIPSTSYYGLVNDNKSTFWSKIEMIDSSGPDKDWFFVFYNYSIDSLKFYVIMDDSVITEKQYSVHQTKLSDKELEHKNFAVDLSVPKNRKITLLLKSRNGISSHYGYAIKEHRYFFSYSVGEYFYYGLFYGALLLIIVYHLSFLISLKNLSYLFYVLYILFQGLYMTFRDAMVVAVIMPEVPQLVRPSFAIINILSSVFLLLYARFFLTLNNYKAFDWAIKIYIPFRVLAWIIEPVHNNYHIVLDYIPVLIVFAFSVISLTQKHKTSHLLCIGFFILMLSHTINALWHNNIIDCTPDVFYSMYYGVLTESVLLAFANAYRLNLLKQDALQKLKLENQIIKDELKIQQQSSIIQEQKDQIDNFLYRASHDIKGPLKSIDGLARLGLIDEKSNTEYFSRIQTMTVRLQKIVDNFLGLVKNNNSKLKVESINMHSFFTQCIEEQFFEYPGRNEIEIKLSVPENFEIVTEYYSLYSVIQNVIENAIKYKDPSKQHNYIIISAIEHVSSYTITIEDNGQGISAASKEKIFSMFYRANLNNTEGVGMGLYIVKQSLERIKGQISIDSKENEYSKFLIKLPKEISGS